METTAGQEWVQTLRVYPPFSRLDDGDWPVLLAGAEERRFAPDAVVLAPQDGPPDGLWIVLEGRIVGRRPDGWGGEEVFELTPGDLFPAAAWTARRPVTATYRALGDLRCLHIPTAAAAALAERSVVWADCLQQRARAYLQMARQRLQAELAARGGDAPPTLETRLGDLPRREPVTLAATASVRDALQTMSERRVGSVLLLGDDGALAGILTRHDVLDRIALAGTDLAAPVSSVMTRPVATLQADDTTHDAMMLMSRRRIRHVPVLEQGRLVNLVSERDLFALQRLSIKHLGTAIAHCRTLADFQRAAADIRAYARHLMVQGVQARQLTALISHLNDQLTQGLVAVALQAAGLSADAMCWIALGSEGRGEQTLATDQDNALVFASDDPQADRPRWLAFARRVNEALDACGYPLCQGGIMAGNPPCCLTAQEWGQRFGRWIDAGGPQELLQASVFFDLRAVAGRADWLDDLRAMVLARTRTTPRFIRQLVQVHLEHPVALNWYGGIEGRREGSRLWFDLKLQGTALLVEGARILALAQGLAATGTRERLLSAGRAIGAPAPEVEGWVTAFDFLQLLRLARQSDASADPDQPNRIDLNTLNPVDERVLKASLRAIRTLQQRLQLDYLR